MRRGGACKKKVSLQNGVKKKGCWHAANIIYTNGFLVLGVEVVIHDPHFGT